MSIDAGDPPTDPASLDTVLTAMAARARAGHRLLLWLQGEGEPCRLAATRAVELLARGLAPGHSPGEEFYWVSPGQPALSALPASCRLVQGEKAALRMLGSGSGLLVFDALAGFDPNLFAICSGTVVGGGLMILLCPAAMDPARDAVTQRMMPAAPSAQTHLPPRSLFHQRLLSHLESAARAGHLLRMSAQSLLDENSPRAPCAPSNNLAVTRDTGGPALQATAAQRQAVAATVALLHEPCGTVLLCAARGRGKTSALGFALQAILENKFPRRAALQGNVLVVAPHPEQVQPLFTVLDSLMPGNMHQRVQYKPADIALLENAGSPVSTGLLVIDEASGIALPVLQRLLRHFPRRLIATTAGGYEGSGSGFAVRAIGMLENDDKNCPLNRIFLEQPLRWARDDPLETFSDALLCTQPGGVVLPGKHAGPGSASGPDAVQRTHIGVTLLEAENLARDEALLGNVFSLLAAAHYQTEPRDLRLLLDAPYTRLWVAKCGTQVIGVLLALEEGGLAPDDALLSAITSGQRRPRGNLVAQRLANILGQPQWLSCQSLRVSRIAVRQDFRRRGVASRLHNAMREYAQGEIHFISSSFAYQASLCEYWQAQSMLPVYLGTRLDKSSGARSLLVVEALNAELQQAARQATVTLLQDLQFWQRRFLPEFDHEDRSSLERFCKSSLERFCDNSLERFCKSSLERFHDNSLDAKPELEARPDLRRVDRFAAGELSMEYALPAVERILRGAPLASGPAVHSLQLAINLAPDWSSLAAQIGCSGRSALQDALRKACRELLVQPDPQVLS